MTVIRPLILLATAVLLAACASSPRVHSNADPQADFSRYQSFGFVQPAGTDRGEYATILTSRLQQAARQALEARGYRYDPASPDLLVNFNLSAQRVLESRPSPYYGWGGYYPHRWGWYGPWAGWHHEPVRQFTEGTLNIDLVDAGERRLVWEGMAVARLTGEGYAGRDRLVDEAVASIFARFPHTAGGR
ncbi:MAG: DUF4136 domain-containing protein [Lysobacteraceae bacterium]